MTKNYPTLATKNSKNYLNCWNWSTDYQWVSANPTAKPRNEVSENPMGKNFKVMDNETHNQAITRLRKFFRGLGYKNLRFDKFGENVDNNFMDTDDIADFKKKHPCQIVYK